ncbi:MAG: hypothetical protein HSCHL_1229 [Hydrogenibacillus schlegelii]|uniref:Uncharacterized protein n=1 Tax=Hydrogenibacillus schlegelii TaxID=1484 RepID=A0A2T5GCF9_HYDSH|nr:MAG: hypothetical protein HSCHL_1229 [Hydrogenibacillus schlegelii]
MTPAKRGRTLPLLSFSRKGGPGARKTSGGLQRRPSHPAGP